MNETTKQTTTTTGNNEFVVIPGYSKYKIDKSGNVISMQGKEDRVLKHQLLNQTGQYYSVTLYDDTKKKKIWTIHRLLWTVFNGEIADGLVIDHVDNDSKNNVLSNLQVITKSENQQKSIKSRKSIPIIAIDVLDTTFAVYKSASHCARGISETINRTHIPTIADRIRACKNNSGLAYNRFRVFDAENDTAKAYRSVMDLLDKRLNDIAFTGEI